MASRKSSNVALPEAQDFAVRSVEKAREAIDSFMGVAWRAAGTFEGSTNTLQATTKDATRRSFSYAEQNLAAAFDLAQRMVRAKDPQEAMQIQAEFVRAQFQAMQTQMKEFSSLVQSHERRGIQAERDNVPVKKPNVRQDAEYFFSRRASVRLPEMTESTSSETWIPSIGSNR